MTSRTSTITNKHRRIFLWGCRRTLSITLQRAIFQLQHQSIEHVSEPFCFPFFLGDESVSAQFSKKEQKQYIDEFASPSIKESIEECTQFDKRNPKQIKFIKEHALYIWPRIEKNQIPTSLFTDEGTKHTFIIRHPEKTLTSLWRRVLEPQISKLTHFVGSEAGFREQYLLHNYLQNELNLDTFILDANDLLRNPKLALQKYCDFVELQYNDCMLDWSNDDNFEEEKPWMVCPVSFIRDINATTTFREKDVEYDSSDYPQCVFDAVEESLPFYQELYQQRVIIE